MIKAINRLGPGHWIAWWHGGFLANDRAPSEKLITILFRKIVGNQPEGPTVLTTIGITQIGQVPIGSIWYRGERFRNYEFDERIFKVDFADTGYQVVSLEDSGSRYLLEALGRVWPTYLKVRKPENVEHANAPNEAGRIELVPAVSDKSKLIKLPTAEGPSLLLPCMEIFSRMYGRSAEVKRAIAGYPWDFGEHGAKRFLYVQLDEPKQANIWKVMLQRKCVNGDVVFLAHAEYDPFTEKAVQTINADILAHKLSEAKKPKKSACFPVIKPWFEGPATLRVAGVALNNDLFLGLRILGSTDPGGALIERDRVDRDRATREMTEGKSDKYEWESVRRIRRHLKPPIVDLTSDEEPDQGSSIVEVQDDPFQVIGERRTVIDKPLRTRKRTGHVTNVPGDGNENRFSGGAEGGSGKDVGYAHILTPEIGESVGTQLGMWTALVGLKDGVDNNIEYVQWFTFEDRFQSNGLPKQIFFRPFRNPDQLLRSGEKPRVINWVYIDPDAKRMRGLVVMRIKIDGEIIYFIEQGRRRNEAAEKEKDKEEKFSGLVFKLDQEADLEIMLEEIMFHLPRQLGIMKHVLNYCRGEAYAYKHVSIHDEIHFPKTVKNALRKMAIKI